MKTSKPNPTDSVGSRLQAQLEQIDKTPEELADAAGVPPKYIEDLLAGRRRLPPPSRTDLYPRITSFCKLGRTELENWTTEERQREPAAPPGEPSKKVCDRLLAMCEPETAKQLQRRGARDDKQELMDYFERILSATRRAVRRLLADQAALRIASDRSGKTLATGRLEILDFLERSAADLTVQDLERFVTPHLASWDVDLEGGVLRVFMRS